MELAANHLQIVSSVVAIGGAAAIALFCDLIRRNNEQLRLVNVELSVRHAEEVRHNQRLLETITAAPAAALASAASTPSALPALGADSARAQAEAAYNRGTELTSRRGVRKSLASQESEVSQSELAAVPSRTGTSLAEARVLAREFLGRASDRARMDQEADSSDSAAPKARQPEVIVETPESAMGGLNLPRKNWDQLLRKLKQQETVEAETRPATGRTGELIPFETIHAADLSVPEGFHEAMLLARFLNSGKAVRGLVIVVGMNDDSGWSNDSRTESIVDGVSQQIRSLLAPGEFACQSSASEFVVICPFVEGSAAQRRLDQISEVLWDYQVRVLEANVAMFSWGSVEGKGESFPEVLSKAAERMRESRRCNSSRLLEAPERRVAV